MQKKTGFHRVSYVPYEKRTPRYIPGIELIIAEIFLKVRNIYVTGRDVFKSAKYKNVYEIILSDGRKLGSVKYNVKTGMYTVIWKDGDE